MSNTIYQAVYASGYRDNATKLADEAFAMCDATLVERPWDFYLKSSATELGWRASTALAELGEKAKSQEYLRRSWKRMAAIRGLPSFVDKYPDLPLKGKVPSNVSEEDREFFESIASGAKKAPEGSSKFGMTRFTIPCDFSGTKYPFFIFIVGGKAGYPELQDQFVWLKESRGGTIPKEVEESFRNLNKIAIDNNVDFRELCVYALGPKEEDKSKPVEKK